MRDINQVKKELTAEMESLVFETATLARVFKETNFHGHPKAFPNAHYGYLMACMGKIDVLSAYHDGRVTAYGQTQRMISFMDRYLYPGRSEEHKVAVKMFRHTLMHTGALRFIYDPATDTRYTWRVHLDDQLPPASHYTVTIEDSRYRHRSNRALAKSEMP